MKWLLSLINFGLFVAFPLVAFKVYETPDLRQKTMEWVPALCKVTMYLCIYYSAFQRSSHKRSAASFFFSVFKYVLLSLAARLINHINDMRYDMPEIVINAQSGALTAIAIQSLPEIFVSLIVMFLGFAKIGLKTPFFMTLCLWPVYICVGGLIHDEVVNTYPTFKKVGFSIMHPQVLESVIKFSRYLHETSMSIALVNTIFFSLDWELLIVSMLGNIAALFAGFYTMHYAALKVVAQLSSLTGKHLPWTEERLQSQASLFVIFVVLSIYLHYSYDYVMLPLANVFGRKERVLQSPFHGPVTPKTSKKQQAK